MTPDRKHLIDVKLTAMIQELGNDFDMYLRENNQIDILTTLQATIVPHQGLIAPTPLPIINANPALFSSPLPIQTHAAMVESNLYSHVLVPEASFGNDGSVLETVPVLTGTFVPKNVYKLCENHPRMKDCICAAYPLSVICEKSYCVNHPNYYECSPHYCDIHPQDIEACKCKFRPFDLDCQCKIDPIKKECFCLKYPTASYCLPDFCSLLNNNSQIFCLCKNNPLATECNPSYCFENKYDSRCKCLLSNTSKDCHCVFNPSETNCMLKNNSDDYTKGVGLIKQFKKSSKNKDESTCHKNDIYCLCKDHPSYKDCVCVAFPAAPICTENYCQEHFDDYRCNPNKECDDIDEDCKCKKDFSKCKCELTPYDKECFCKKYSKSYLCNMANCSFDKENLLCKCKDDSNECEISKKCGKDKSIRECYCLVNDEKDYCKCLNDASRCSSINTLIRKRD
jgi:hypothetical protein